MKTKVEVELKPFDVPDYVHNVNTDEAFVVKSSDLVTEKTFALGELDSHVLMKMCDDFRDSVFAKAGKRKPPMNAPTAAPRVPENHGNKNGGPL